MTEKKFVQILANIFSDEGYITKREIGVGYGIADLVLIKKSQINTSNFELRKSYKQKNRLLKEDFFKVLDSLPEEDNTSHRVDINQILKKTHISESHLKYNILRTLAKNNYIKIEDGHYYVKINGWLPLAKEVVAVEAKLKDWKRGMIQANRYKTFANKSYLAIPKYTVRLVDKNFLRKHGIGLISLDLDKKTKRVVVAAKKAKPRSYYKHNLAIEFFWTYNLKNLATTPS